MLWGRPAGTGAGAQRQRERMWRRASERERAALPHTRNMYAPPTAYARRARAHRRHGGDPFTVAVHYRLSLCRTSSSTAQLAKSGRSRTQFPVGAYIRGVRQRRKVGRIRVNKRAREFSVLLLALQRSGGNIIVPVLCVRVRSCVFGCALSVRVCVCVCVHRPW